MLLLAACAEPDLPVHHLVYGGDTLVGQTLNEAILDPAGRAEMLADVAPILKAADLALLNSEGVIARGGKVLDKGEARPHLYRARPEMMAILADAGVDLLANANNHAGDYGFDALREHLDHARIAGLDYAGAGHDLADARTPAYRLVGDTVVAVVGVDLTNTAAYAATDDHPGILAVAPKDAVATLKPILEEARRHAHVVFLTPHWGPNGATEPTKETRRVGKALIRAGFDAILGHSAHVPQGAELVDGKPILYDAGNFLAGHPGTGDQAAGLLYDVAFTRAGVVSVKAIPLALPADKVVLGDAATITTWAGRTRALGAEPAGDTLACDPGDVAGPEGSPAPPVRAVPAAVREAPRDTIVEAVPPEATPTRVRWANGVTLVGYRLVAKALRVPKAAQGVELYFTADGAVAHDLTVDLAARGDRNRHYPGDWMLPGDEWPPGAIVRDRSLVRLLGKPEGTVRFVLNLREGRGALEIVESALPVEGGVVLGETPYVEGTPRIFLLPEMW
ncbi:MAG: CapA family protein [Myxococcota bacterium]